MKKLNPSALLKPSGPMTLFAKVKQMQAAGIDVVSLSVGELDSPSPTVASDAGIEAIRTGHTRYTPNPGVIELRKAIADSINDILGDISCHIAG